MKYENNLNETSKIMFKFSTHFGIYDVYVMNIVSIHIAYYLAFLLSMS